MASNVKHPTDDFFPASDPLSMSLDFIEELSKTGIVLAPVEPTELMVKRGSSIGNVTPEQAKTVYFAMIAMSN
jgi:hypothetical protein